MKHSKTPPFCKEHPGTIDKHTRTQGSSQRHLRRRRHQSNTSAPPSPPSASPRDTKTLEMLQKLAPQTNHDASFSLNGHRPSRRQGRKRKKQSNATDNPSALRASATEEKTPTKALTSHTIRRIRRRRRCPGGAKASPCRRRSRRHQRQGRNQTSYAGKPP
jgi:hypothetical protein